MEAALYPTILDKRNQTLLKMGTVDATKNSVAVNATSQRRPHKPPTILNEPDEEPPVYRGPITTDGKMKLFGKEEIEATPRGFLKLRRIYYFNSFINPHRKKFMESWIELLGVPYQRIEPMMGNQPLCQTQNCLDSFRLSNSYRRLLEPTLAHVYDISGTVLAVESDRVSVDMKRLDQFLGNFTEKWQVLRLDCDTPSSPEDPNAVWYRPHRRRSKNKASIGAYVPMRPSGGGTVSTDSEENWVRVKIPT
jgi:hypothetical protein